MTPIIIRFWGLKGPTVVSEPMGTQRYSLILGELGSVQDHLLYCEVDPGSIGAMFTV